MASHQIGQIKNQSFLNDEKEKIAQEEKQRLLIQKKDQNQNNQNDEFASTRKSLQPLFDLSLQQNNINEDEQSSYMKNSKSIYLEQILQSASEKKSKKESKLIVQDNEPPINNSLHRSGNKTPFIENNQNNERIKRLQQQTLNEISINKNKQNKIPEEKNTYFNYSGSASYYSVSNWTPQSQSSFKIPSQILSDGQMSEIDNSIFKQPIKFKSQIKQEIVPQNAVIDLNQSNLKIQKISQLPNLKNIIQQKQMNESFKQYQVPQKKIKKEFDKDHSIDINQNLQSQENVKNYKSSQGLNTAEKNTLYDPQYLQRIGLPIPETVQKQKKLEKQMEQLKENVQPEFNILNREQQKQQNIVNIQSENLIKKEPSWLNQKFKREEKDNQQSYQQALQQQKNNNKNNEQSSHIINQQNTQHLQQNKPQIKGFRANDTFQQTRQSIINQTKENNFNLTNIDNKNIEQLINTNKNSKEMNESKLKQQYQTNTTINNKQYDQQLQINKIQNKPQHSEYPPTNNMIRKVDEFVDKINNKYDQKQQKNQYKFEQKLNNQNERVEENNKNINLGNPQNSLIDQNNEFQNKQRQISQNDSYLINYKKEQQVNPIVNLINPLKQTFIPQSQQPILTNCTNSQQNNINKNNNNSLQINLLHNTCLNNNKNQNLTNITSQINESNINSMPTQQIQQNINSNKDNQQNPLKNQQNANFLNQNVFSELNPKNFYLKSQNEEQSDINQNKINKNDNRTSQINLKDDKINMEIEEKIQTQNLNPLNNQSIKVMQKIQKIFKQPNNSSKETNQSKIQKDKEEKERLQEIKKAQQFKQQQTSKIQKRTLNEHEKKVLFIVWMKKNLQDFNYWIQKSKSKTVFDYSEEGAHFTCKATLSFPNFSDLKPLFAMGTGQGKKDSKKSALEKLAINVILNDQIFWLGITGRTYLENILVEYADIVNTPEGQKIIDSIIKYTNFYDDKTALKQQSAENQSDIIKSINSQEEKQNLKPLNKIENKQQDQMEIEGKNNSQKNDDNDKQNKCKQKISKFFKKMQQMLQENKVINAVEKLAQVGSVKNSLTYRDFCFIWNYGIKNKNLTLLKICIDVVHYRKFSSQMIEALQNQISNHTKDQLFKGGNPNNISEKLTQINSVLKKYLTTCRCIDVQNPYEEYNTNITYLADDEWYAIRQSNSTLFPSSDKNQKYMNETKSFLNIDFENFSISKNLQIVESLNFTKQISNKSSLQHSDKKNSSQKQQVYISATKKRAILSGNTGSGFKEEMNLRNQTFIRSSALFFKNDNSQYYRNELISNKSLHNAMNRKDPYLQYLSWEDLNSMYMSLMYTDDHVFALQACELIYTLTKIDSSLLINNCTGYYANRKVILFEEFFENLFIKINNTDSIQRNILSSQFQNNPQQQAVPYMKKNENMMLQGYIQYLGCSYELDIFQFRIIGENGEVFSINQVKLQEGDLCVLYPKLTSNSLVEKRWDFNQQESTNNYQNRFMCIVRDFNEESISQNASSQTEQRSAALNYNTLKMSLVIGDNSQRSRLISDFAQVYILQKVSSTKNLREQNKALDTMCTKVTMLHSIFKNITLLNHTSENQVNGNCNFTLNKPNQNENNLPTIVATEINLQALAMENNLNQDQVDALLSGSIHALSVIQGVKDTGKFRVATSIVQEWLIQSNLKILIKCDSDSKARKFYNYLVNLQQSSQSCQQQNNSQNSQRTLQQSAFTANICMILDDDSVEFFNSHSRQYMTQKMSAKVKRSIEDSKIVILGASSIYHNKSSYMGNVSQKQQPNDYSYSTSSVAACSNSLRDCQFNRIILYNAEQIKESLTLEFLIRNCNQCVLIGDITTFQRNQTKSLFSKSRFGDRSIFENIIINGFKPIVLKKRYFNTQIYSNIKKQQIKQKQENTLKIAKLHNDLFFDNSLLFYAETQNTNQPKQYQQCIIEETSNKQDDQQEILVVALKGKEQVSNPSQNNTLSDAGSIYNIEEINIILGIVSCLIREQKIDQNQIKIITPTIAQKTQMQFHSSSKLKTIMNIQTIQEPIQSTSEVIIYSGVRSNEQEDLGVTRNPSILSAMLQHTSQQFIFVGDIDLYSIDLTWSDFFQKAFTKKQVKFHNYQQQKNQSIQKNLGRIFDSQEKEQGEI